MHIFIVPGFGMPTDFENDPTYISYLNKVTAHIMNFKATRPEEKFLVIFSGGNSDLNPPYGRTEAEEMQKLFLHLAGDKLPGLNMELEKTSLSSLDNLLYSNEIIKRHSDEVERVSIFCEETRENRTKITAEKIFLVPTEVVPEKLYTDEQLKDIELMMKKEKVALKYSLWALESTENPAKSREAYANKFKILREAQPEQREGALKQWWQDMIEQARIVSNSVERPT